MVCIDSYLSMWTCVRIAFDREYCAAALLGPAAHAFIIKFSDVGRFSKASNPTPKWPFYLKVPRIIGPDFLRLFVIVSFNSYI